MIDEIPTTTILDLYQEVDDILIDNKDPYIFLQRVNESFTLSISPNNHIEGYCKNQMFNDFDGGEFISYFVYVVPEARGFNLGRELSIQNLFNISQSYTPEMMVKIEFTNPNHENQMVEVLRNLGFTRHPNHYEVYVSDLIKRFSV